MSDQQDQDDTRRIILTPASHITPKKVRWAWKWNGDGRIPSGSLALAAGREGTGKSSFGMWLAAQITAGTLPGTYQGEPRNVLYVAVEDSWEYTLVPRLMAARADLNKVFRVQATDVFDEEVTMTLPLDNAKLEQAVRQTEAAMVVCDPLMSLLGEKLSASKSREVRLMLDPLVRIAQATDCIMLGIAHHNKGNHSDPIMAVSESKAWTDVPRSVFAFARDEENQCRVMSQTKNSLGRDASSLPSLRYQIEPAAVQLSDGIGDVGRFVVTGVSDKSVADLTREQAFGGDPEDRNAAQAFVFDYLARNGGEAEAGDVIKAGRAAGFNDQTIKDARRRMSSPKVDSRKASMGNGWVWAFREEAPATNEGGTKVAKVAKVAELKEVATSVPPSHPDPEGGRRWQPSITVPPLPPSPPSPPSEPAPYCPHAGPIGMPCNQCPGGVATAA